MSDSRTPWTAAHQLLCPWGFYRQEYIAMPFFRGPSQPGIEPRSPTLQVDSLTTEPAGKPKNTGVGSLSLLQGIFQTREDLGSPVLQANSLPVELPGKPISKNDISLTLAIWTYVQLTKIFYLCIV